MEVVFFFLRLLSFLSFSYPKEKQVLWILVALNSWPSCGRIFTSPSLSFLINLSNVNFLKKRVIPGTQMGVCVLSHFSRVHLFVTLWAVVHQVPLSMGFSRQEYWSGLPFSPPGDLPGPGIEPVSPTSPTLAGGFFTSSATWVPGRKKHPEIQPCSPGSYSLDRKLRCIHMASVVKIQTP